MERTGLRVFAEGGIQVRDDEMPDFGVEGSVEESAIVEKTASDAGPDGEISKPPDAPSGSVKRFAEGRGIDIRLEGNGQVAAQRREERGNEGKARPSFLGRGEDRSEIRGGAVEPGRPEGADAEGLDGTVACRRFAEEGGRSRDGFFGGSGGEAGFEERTRRIGGDGTDIFRASRLDRTEQRGVSGIVRGVHERGFEIRGYGQETLDNQAVKQRDCAKERRRVTVGRDSRL